MRLRSIAGAVVAASVCVLTWARAPGSAAAEVPPRQRLSRVFHAPTAWLPEDRVVVGSAGLTHHTAPFVAVSAGLGGLAEVGIGVDDVSGRTLGTGIFRAGWTHGRVGGALGFRKSFAGEGRVAELYAVGSADLGEARVHAGVERWDAATEAGPDGPVRMATALRPFGGIEWTPSLTPRSTLAVDLAWAPRFDDMGGVFLKWVGDFGARYQIMRWGSIELAVQFREDDKLDEPTIFIRLNLSVDALARR